MAQPAKFIQIATCNPEMPTRQWQIVALDEDGVVWWLDISQSMWKRFASTRQA